MEAEGNPTVFFSDLQDEEWRDVPGYEGLYQVSDQGRIKSFHRDPAGIILKTCKKTNKAHPTPYSFYEAPLYDRSGNRRVCAVHRLVAITFLGLTSGNLQVDHINHDSLDNRLSNLRLCTKAENRRNSRKPLNSTAPYKGISYDKQLGKWRSQILANGKRIWLGVYDTPEEAHAAYCEAAKQYFGEFARFE